jgi:predicted regulator of Ras-like GTPase activity (Roadblock/LC7/MglB family)
MDAAQALSELTALSAQITAAIVLEKGAPAASTLDEERSRALAQTVKELVEVAGKAAGRDGGRLAQLEVAMPAGSVFVVRDGKRTIAATTRPEPAAGLVFYDLKTSLRGIGDAPKPKPKPSPKPRARKKATDDAAT